MEDTLKNAYAEVEKILDILGDKYKQKLPEKVRNLFQEKKNTNYEVKIDKKTKIEDIKVSRTALIIISILNLKYWEEDPDKKEELKEIYDKNEVKYQEKINIYKQDEWLKNRNSKKKIKIEEKNTETDLIVQQDIPIITKIKKFFMNLIHNRK